jgi:hypothetical protein
MSSRLTVIAIGPKKRWSRDGGGGGGGVVVNIVFHLEKERIPSLECYGE